MSAYIVRRLLLMIPTLLGILFVSFLTVQFAPGGPVDRVIAQLYRSGEIEDIYGRWLAPLGKPSAGLVGVYLLNALPE